MLPEVVLQFLVGRLRRAGEALVDVGVHAQVVADPLPQPRLAGVGVRQRRYQITVSDAALDVAHLGLDGRALGLRRRVPLHLLKNQHTVDQPLERDRFPRRRAVAVHQVQRHRPLHVGERDQMAVHDDHHAVDDLGGRGCASHEEQSQQSIPDAPHQKACPRLMCSAVSRSKLPSGSVWRSSLKPRSTRIGPMGDL